MNGINEIAKDIATEVQDQGVKLDKVLDSHEQAEANVNRALSELKEAKIYQKKSSKCIWFLVSIIILCLIITGLIVYFVFFHGQGDEVKES